MKEFLKKIVTIILTWEARILLARTKPKIIAITGSVGKTTTKDAIFAVVSSIYHTRKSEKSFNSEIGVPLTVLGLDTAWGSMWGWGSNILTGLVRALTVKEYPEYLVLEVGADHPGDIQRPARWLTPDIAVITALPEIPVHVAYFDSPEAVSKEKLSLAKYMKKDGTLIVNGDDELLMRKTTLHTSRLTYGYSENATVRSDTEEIIYESEKPIGVRSVVTVNTEKAEILIRGSLGKPRIYAYLAALAVAHKLSINLTKASEALLRLEPTPGRMRLLSGKNGSTIIDDTYNSSPVAAIAALETLEQIKAKRRVAILGDMRELGHYSAEAHRSVGKKAAAVADILITVGAESRTLADAAKEGGMPEERITSYGYDESTKVGMDFAEHIQEGDIVLVKGSQNRIRLERAVKEIMEHPENATTLLVRQEKEWGRR